MKRVFALCTILVLLLPQAAFAAEANGEEKFDPNGQKTYPARRWVVERTLAWLGRCRRLAKDWEKTIESSSAWAFVASIRLLSRRLQDIAIQRKLLSRALSICRA